MKAGPMFLLLSYMHRDAGNYKTFGSAVLENDLHLPLEQIDEKLKATLIDGCYFYPFQWRIPNLNPLEGNIDDFEEWNEYLGLEEFDGKGNSMAYPISRLLKTSNSL